MLFSLTWSAEDTTVALQTHCRNGHFSAIVPTMSDTIYCCPYSAWNCHPTALIINTQATPKQIDIQAICRKQDEEVYIALPGMHSPLGWDTTSSFCGKGNKAILTS